MLHSWYSCAGPWQVWPPYLGSGLVQVLLRLRIPRLQSRLHCDQEVQDDQPPFTVFPEILPRRRTSPVWEECWQDDSVVNTFRVQCHISAFLSSQGCCINKVSWIMCICFEGSTWEAALVSEVLVFHFSTINVEGALSSFVGISFLNTVILAAQKFYRFYSINWTVKQPVSPLQRLFGGGTKFSHLIIVM